MGIVTTKTLNIMLEDSSAVTNNNIMIRGRGGNYIHYDIDNDSIFSSKCYSLYYYKLGNYSLELTKEGKILYIVNETKYYGFLPDYNDEGYYRLRVDNNDMNSFFILTNQNKIFHFTCKSDNRIINDFTFICTNERIINIYVNDIQFYILCTRCILVHQRDRCHIRTITLDNIELDYYSIINAYDENNIIFTFGNCIYSCINSAIKFLFEFEPHCIIQSISFIKKDIIGVVCLNINLNVNSFKMVRISNQRLLYTYQFQEFCHYVLYRRKEILIIIFNNKIKRIDFSLNNFRNFIVKIVLWVEKLLLNIGLI